ncbi:MAG: 2'-5' RNA ligase family protein [Rhodococcus sp. (in: high G+C Gram-positive bacteria)]|mgnify:CR=1 FL=1|uniref:2'-5' RNA ligase family protein n=1 Tax=unclassified Rhodococcus (in: high G+C Gram-positive bacteria) TaxID=192944 RepID=UPI000B2DC50A|nr:MULTISPECIES: 2'-5' RNA ligase family protein [unclassified Rhodococcus (in: high G+C Gram-positive bacteria)]
MKSLFDLPMTAWPHERNSLHVYALPQIDSSVLVPIQDAIRSTGVCSVQPTEFLHATVTRIPAFLDTVPADTVLTLRGLLDDATAALEPFTVDMTGPHIFEHSVGYEGNRSPQWDSLVRSVRAGATTVLGDPAMPPAPHAPHISLGYGTADVDSEPLTAELARLGARRGRQQSVRMHVAEVQLLSVHQDSAAGIYTWDTICTAHFGRVMYRPS